MRIEGLLAAFPKLLGSGGQQHTFLETENVVCTLVARFVTILLPYLF